MCYAFLHELLEAVEEVRATGKLELMMSEFRRLDAKDQQNLLVMAEDAESKVVGILRAVFNS